MGFSSTSVCVDIQMTSGSVRLGGPVIGFSGDVNVNGMSMATNVSTGSLSLGACGGITKQTVCFDAQGNLTASSLSFVLTNAETSTGITVGNIHVAGAFCGSSPLFANTTPTTGTVPEPERWGSQNRLVGLAGLAPRLSCRVQLFRLGPGQTGVELSPRSRTVPSCGVRPVKPPSGDHPRPPKPKSSGSRDPHAGEVNDDIPQLSSLALIACGFARCAFCQAPGTA
jgi:hypothetical protein